MAVVGAAATFVGVTTFAFPRTVLIARPKPLGIRTTVEVSAERLGTKDLHGERAITATGRKKRAPATGTVRFTCCTTTIADFFGGPDYPDAIRIPAGTLVWSCVRASADGSCAQQGRVFRTTRAGTITDQDSVSVFFGTQNASEAIPVVAVRAGRAWNGAYITGSSITRARGTTIGVVGVKRPTGGANGGELFVNGNDVTRTANEITALLRSKARAELVARADARGLEMTGFTSSGSTRRTTITKTFFLRESSEPAVTVRLTARAFGYDAAEADRQAASKMSLKVASGYTLVDGSWNDHVTLLRFSQEQRRVRLLMEGEATLSDLHPLERLAEGRSTEEAIAAIRGAGHQVAAIREYHLFGLFGRRLEVRFAGS